MLKQNINSCPPGFVLTAGAARQWGWLWAQGAQGRAACRALPAQSETLTSGATVFTQQKAKVQRFVDSNDDDDDDGA